jgi:hypothetical protein
MDDDALELDRRAAKAEKDDHHPLDDPMPADTSDTADDRVAEPGEDRPSEDSLPERDGFDDRWRAASGSSHRWSCHGGAGGGIRTPTPCGRRF